jgi:hypothetical protein
MTIITPQVARGLALARTAETMLRALGGVEVSVRFATPNSAASAEFGLSASSITDTPVEPVIVRSSDAPALSVPHVREANAGNKNAGPEFLFAASSVQKAALAASYASPVDWFAQSLGIFFDGLLHPIASVSTENFAGQPYLYRVTTNS